MTFLQVSILETFSAFRIVRRIGTLLGVCIKSHSWSIWVNLPHLWVLIGTSRWFRHVLPQLRERKVGLPKIEIDRTRIKRDKILSAVRKSSDAVRAEAWRGGFPALGDASRRAQSQRQRCRHPQPPLCRRAGQ